MGISFQEVSHFYQGPTKKQRTVALKNIHLNIATPGEFIALVGKTGSGKSTLMQHMNALLLPSSGNVVIFGKTITPFKNKNPKLKEIRKKVGFVFQFPEYQLFEETVLKDIMFAPKNFGFSEDEAKKRAEEVAKLLDIDASLLEKSPFHLSGGQMRKVAIAGILAYDPQIILLDEPTRGLDPETAEQVMALFYQIQQQYHKTVVLISHDMDIVYRYANRVVVMNENEIVYDGNKEKLFETGLYLKHHLRKPSVLDMIDFLNEKLGYDLDYHIVNEQELIERLVAYHE